MKSENKVEVLQTEYARAQYEKFEQERRQVVFRRRRLAAIFIAALVIFAIVGIQMFNDQARLQQLQEYKTETLQEQEATNKKENQLQKEVALLQDEDYVAKLARSRFFYSKEDEEIYPIAPDSTGTSESEDLE